MLPFLGRGVIDVGRDALVRRSSLFVVCGFIVLVMVLLRERRALQDNESMITRLRFVSSVLVSYPSMRCAVTS
jgi:hypothetical protein